MQQPTDGSNGAAAAGVQAAVQVAVGAAPMQAAGGQQAGSHNKECPHDVLQVVRSRHVLA
jgi:hypothetical protein